MNNAVPPGARWRAANSISLGKGARARARGSKEDPSRAPTPRPDLAYPNGHLQGFGFVPSDQMVASHIKLEDSVRPVTDVVPTKAKLTGPSAAYF